jgi:hypothetical protein
VRLLETPLCTPKSPCEMEFGEREQVSGTCLTASIMAFATRCLLSALGPVRAGIGNLILRNPRWGGLYVTPTWGHLGVLGLSDGAVK